MANGRFLVTWLILVCAPTIVRAGRPMVTDDTQTAGQGECQIEFWSDRLGAVRSQSLSPACGLTDELELDAGVSRIQGGASTLSSAALGLKWAPAFLVYQVAFGTLSLGVKAGNAWARDTALRWRNDGPALIGLASLALGSSLTIDLNLGAVRSDFAGSTATTLNLGAAWQPDERWLFFGEVLGTDHDRPAGQAGFRWWLVPGTLGLDCGVGYAPMSRATLSLGLGWYRIRLP
ncbi:MAG: hypothetical protein U1E23_19800 [Reyranellaceae bacterium]